MKAGLFYECRWAQMGYSQIERRGWDFLMFIGIETINRSDGVVIDNYRFMDMTTGETFLMDQSLALRCKELNAEDYHERD